MDVNSLPMPLHKLSSLNPRARPRTTLSSRTACVALSIGSCQYFMVGITGTEAEKAGPSTSDVRGLFWKRWVADFSADCTADTGLSDITEEGRCNDKVPEGVHVD